MGTRSNIGIRNSDDSVTGIYCHWDGYPSHHGPLLLNHYNTPETVLALLKLGDLSSLHSKIDPDANVTHTFRTPQDDVCVAYGRDRGEDGTGAVTYHNLAAFERQMKRSNTEYQYLFEDNHWRWRSVNSDWQDLTPADCV